MTPGQLSVVAGRSPATRRCDIREWFSLPTACHDLPSSASRDTMPVVVVANKPADVPKAEAPKPSIGLPGSLGPLVQAFDCGS